MDSNITGKNKLFNKFFKDKLFVLTYFRIMVEKETHMCLLNNVKFISTFCHTKKLICSHMFWKLKYTDV